MLSAGLLQGLTEDQAVEKYKNIDIYSSSFRPMRNTISGNPLRSFMKVHTALPMQWQQKPTELAQQTCIM